MKSKKKKCQTYINSRKVATKGWGQGENRQRLVKGYKFEKKKKCHKATNQLTCLQ